MTRNQKGDTIVEVLLAIAIVSAVLGGAYASASKSLQGTRQAQERGEALKLVEGQIERLKSTLGSPRPEIRAVAQSPNDFCLYEPDGSPGQVLMHNPSVGDATNPCLQGPEGRYLLVISPDSEPRQYTVRAAWEKFGGGEEQTVQIVYRTEQ